MSHDVPMNDLKNVPSKSLRATCSWASVIAQAGRLRDVHLNDLFAGDAIRVQRFTRVACGLTLDFSKQRIDDRSLAQLLELAEERDIAGWARRMFAGEAINNTENRAALHVALRAPDGDQMAAAGKPVNERVHAVLAKMSAFCTRVRDGQWQGHGGESITDVVNIGIGGSDLGPRMICESLEAIAPAGPAAHFVANVDGAQLHSILQTLNPARTLFVVTSKTFTTQETMANAANARAWLVKALGEEAVEKHFVAVSSNAEAVQAFGIGADNMFEFWDWVGGRYSVWSAVGLSTMLRLGPDMFRELLAGAHDMDQHFLNTPAAANLPILMALLAVWNYQALGCASQVIAPYAQRMERFVSWLQQLEMESTGKRVLRDGSPAGPTSPPVWGDVGTNSQHAFFQMLHQGSEVHPVDFILPMAADHPYADQHRLLLANALAQAGALMQGKSARQVREELVSRGLSGEALEAAIEHRVFPGNRPSNLLLLPQLDARKLGALMALYEHRTFALSVLWGINAFDQWGVELGKQLAAKLLSPDSAQDSTVDASTRAHIHLLGQ